MAKQRQLEDANSRLIDSAADLKRQLRPDALQISAERYTALSATPERDVSVQDFVAMRVFEATRPALRELADLRLRCQEAEEERKAVGEERAELADSYARERELHQALQVRSFLFFHFSSPHVLPLSPSPPQEEYQKTLTNLADTKALVQHGNFKIENFDSVRAARDRWESQLTELRERHRQLSAEHEAVLRDREELERDLGAARQAVTLLTQDKEYLTRQGADMAVRMGGQEDRVQALTRQLEEIKTVRRAVSG